LLEVCARGEQAGAMKAAALRGEALVEHGQQVVDDPARKLRCPVLRQQWGQVHRGPHAEADGPGRHAHERPLCGRDGLAAVAPQRRHVRLGLRAVDSAPACAAALPGACQLDLRPRQLPVLCEEERALELAVARHEAHADALGLALAAIEQLQRGLALAEVADHQHGHRERIWQPPVGIVALELRDRVLEPRERLPAAARGGLEPYPRHPVEMQELGRHGRITAQALSERLGLVEHSQADQGDHLIPGDHGADARGVLPSLQQRRHLLERADRDERVGENGASHPLALGRPRAGVAGHRRTKRVERLLVLTGAPQELRLEQQVVGVAVQLARKPLEPARHGGG
jgi:hypothetical protein